MKDLIISALTETFEFVTKRTPTTKIVEEFFDANECSIADLQQIIKDNDLPQDAFLEMWHPQEDNINYDNWNYDGDGYLIDALGFVKRVVIPTTEKDQLRYKVKEMRAKAWINIELILYNNGYSHNYYYYNNDNMFKGCPTEKIDVYNLYINKEWDKLVGYYSKYYVKK